MIVESSMSFSFTSVVLRNISAPGFLANVKVLSPFSASDTKAIVVIASSHKLSLITFTCSFFNVSTRKRPKSSSPTLQHIPASSPFLAAAMATFAGAPPAFLIYSPSFSPGIKSITISPILYMSMSFLPSLSLTAL